MRIDNPFVLFGYDSPKYFCDRVEETRELVEAVLQLDADVPAWRYRQGGIL